ncbi:M23 family metallopeptidase [Paraburkholderia kururiensis]|uniref:M23 family metallopeptidase n=1 Tax=Paraburkholderia kururiensis TaxID=984307 RepID=UPI0005A81924|nr:M23 family metallopeptidase [Paraburkholderia kururiensis]
MIISPPFLPASGLTSTDGSKPDPMMDAVDKFELAHGIYPVAADRSWHCGAHLAPDLHGPVHAIADGEVVAYRVCQHAMDDGNGNAGFVLLKHSTETGDGRTLTFYSLYMHLLPLAEYHAFGHDGTQLPAFLHKSSGQDTRGKVAPAAKGNGQKVRRKDVLGFLGRYQGVTYLHFEIFMTPGDFDAYFRHTQLGVASPATATTRDCWGHTCFTIPAGQQFYALPPGADAHGKLHGIAFKAGLAGTNALPLVVEMYFSKGAKYTNVWSVAADGSRTLLTFPPVEEKDYEYDLYHRATALYEACPSDGYEMLRFGRILSTPATLSGAGCVTWVQITFAAGQSGYIDINNAAIGKLSDADFPSFMGWQKISDGNTPFGSDGLCDVEMLKKLVRDAAANEPVTVVKEATEVQKADALSYYVKGHDEVRRTPRGFICNAPSEWDSTHNETRFAKLLDEGGFYHGNRKGYEDFLKYLKELQFWDVTGLPAGEKLWFFHPLAFIRHFRKCGWLSKDETVHCIRKTIRDRNREVAPLSKSEVIKRLTEAAERRPANLHPNFQIVARKYGISSSSLRLAHLFGQLTAETGRLEFMVEGGRPEYFDKYEPGHPQGDTVGNTTRGDGIRFKGRGIIQITGRSNYENYGAYRHMAFNNDETSSLISTDSHITCDASGWYWVQKQRLQLVNDPETHKKKLVPLGRLSINYWADQGADDKAILQVTKCVNPAGLLLEWRSQGFRNAFYELNDEVVPSPDFKPAI